MEMRLVGSSGLRVSAVGLGCNNFGKLVDDLASVAILHKALDLGVTLFDTAPVYGGVHGGSEEILGRALGSRRKDVSIVTKFGLPPDRNPPRNTSRAAIMREIEDSLSRLRTDYIDIYMLHWPDAATPMDETLRALDDIVSQGKARYIGCSNLDAWQLVDANWISRTNGLPRFIVSQNAYNIARREVDETLAPALRAHGVGLMPYSPLANGLLTGKFSSKTPPPADSRLGKNMWGFGDYYLAESRLLLADRLGEFATSRGHSLIELAHGWLLSNPLVCSVIGGATRVEQVEANVAAGNAWRLTADEMAQVDEICRDCGKGGVA